MPDGVTIPGGPSFAGSPQPPDVPCDPTGEGWRGPPGPAGVPGPAGTGEFVNVSDYGAKGDGTTDDSAAIQAAATAAAGKLLLFPPATYSLGSPIYLSSGTTVMAHGAVIVPTPTIANLPASGNPAIGAGTGPVCFTNVNWQATSLTDQNISFFGGKIGPLAGPPLGCHGIFLRMVTNTHVAGVIVQNLNDGIAHLACRNTVVERCYSLDCGNCAFDHWDGAQNATVRDCEIRGTGANNGVLFNTDSTVAGHSSGSASNCLIENVRVYDCGTGIYAGPILGGLSCINVQVRACYLYNCPTGITFQEVTGGSITDNKLDTCSSNPITVSVTGVPANISAKVNIIGNLLQNCAPTGGYYIIAAGPNMVVANNRAISSSCYIAIDVDDPTTVVLQNDLPGYTAAYLANQHPWGGATTPALELDADRTNHRWNFVNDIAAQGALSVAGAVSGAGFAPYAPKASPSFTGVVTLGTGTGTPQLLINGGNSGATDGPALYLQWAGAYSGFLGGYSAYFGGSFDGRVLLMGTNGIVFSTQGVVAGGFDTGRNFTCTQAISAATSIQCGGGTGPTWTTGSAAPAATAPVGSLYSRTGGAVGATLYVSRGGGTWAAVAGV